MPPKATLKNSKRNLKPADELVKLIDPEDKENDPTPGQFPGFIELGGGRGDSSTVRDAMRELINEMVRPQSSFSSLSSSSSLSLSSSTPPSRPTKTCGQIRQMLRRYMANTGVQEGDLRKEIGVSERDWDTFMFATGPRGGVMTDTYLEASLFFKRRELKGMDAVPKKTKAKAASAATTKRKSGDGDSCLGAEQSSNKKSKTTAATSTKTKPKKKVPPTAADLAYIEFVGEEDDEVPVFDTCDTVRRHISNFLRRDGATQAQLCRDLTAMLQTGGKVQAPTLTRFRNHHGPNAGACSNTFYAGFVFFEKLRIHEGKPKSQDREIMEDLWEGQGGFRRDIDSNTKLIVPANSNNGVDKYGMWRSW